MKTSVLLLRAAMLPTLKVCWEISIVCVQLWPVVFDVVFVSRAEVVASEILRYK